MQNGTARFGRDFLILRFRHNEQNDGLAQGSARAMVETLKEVSLNLAVWRGDSRIGNDGQR